MSSPNGIFYKEKVYYEDELKNTFYIYLLFHNEVTKIGHKKMKM
jgi:hypothetical protein